MKPFVLCRGRWMLTSALIAASLCCAWSPLLAGAAAPRTLTLSAADVSDVAGSGFQGSGLAVPNVQVSMADRVPTRRVNHYRIDGYTTTFHRAANQGVTAVADEVDRFRSVAGARWGYALMARVNAAPPGTKLVKTGSLGDRSHAFSYSSPFLSVVAVFVQRGDYTARINVYEVHTTPIATALRLAHTLDIRMQNQH